MLADIHGNRQALLAVLDAAASANVDRFLFVGDVVGYGPRPRECIELLAELPNATLIRGNHDHAIAHGRLHVGMNRLARRCAEWTLDVVTDSEREWLGSLPTEHCEEEWIAVHGAPKDPNKFLAYVYELTYEDNLRHLRHHSTPLCFYGHTHVQLVHAELPSGPQKLTGIEELDLGRHRPLLINPGSVGQPRDGDWRAAFALWHRSEDRLTFHRVAYDVTRTIQDVQNRGLPQELCARLQGGN